MLSNTNPGFQPFAYAGGLYDTQTKLVRFGARDYDSYTGRWTAKDPIGFEATTGLYEYCNNDPVNRIDVWGLFDFMCCKNMRVVNDFLFEDTGVVYTERIFFPYVVAQANLYEILAQCLQKDYSLGNITFVIGREVQKRIWAMFRHTTLFCDDPPGKLELEPVKIEGTEKHVEISGTAKDITRTVGCGGQGYNI